MAYTVEDHGEHVHITMGLNEKGLGDTWRFSRAQAQEWHEALAVVCAGDCACWKAGNEYAFENVKE